MGSSCQQVRLEHTNHGMNVFSRENVYECKDQKSGPFEGRIYDLTTGDHILNNQAQTADA